MSNIIFFSFWNSFSSESSLTWPWSEFEVFLIGFLKLQIFAIRFLPFLSLSIFLSYRVSFIPLTFTFFVVLLQAWLLFIEILASPLTSNLFSMRHVDQILVCVTYVTAKLNLYFDPSTDDITLLAVMEAYSQLFPDKMVSLSLLSLSLDWLDPIISFLP